MTRPKNADSAITYERITTAATELIQEQGATAVTLRRVAERAGLSLGAVTYYFTNRQDLLEACLDQNYVWIEGQVSGALTRIMGGTPWKDEVDAFVRVLYRETRKNRELLRTRLLTTMQNGELPEGRLERELVPTLEKISNAMGGSKQVAGLRLAAHTLELVVTRYALHTDEGMQKIVGADSIDQAHEQVEEHLVSLCVHAFQSALS